MKITAINKGIIFFEDDKKVVVDKKIYYNTLKILNIWNEVTKYLKILNDETNINKFLKNKKIENILEYDNVCHEFQKLLEKYDFVLEYEK